MGKRRSVNSPAKWKRRNRRRIHCSRCGSNYSYSGSRSHVCPQATSAQSQTRTREEQVPDLDLNATSEEETGFDCLQDNSDTEEENTSPTRCDENADTEQFLSADLRRRLKDRLRKRFNEEDLHYFDDDSSDENESATDCSYDSSEGPANGHHSPNSVNEDWSDSHGSSEPELPEEDFAERPQEQDNSMPLSDKCGCSFFGFYCSYFPGSLDFLLQIQLWRCYLNFLVVFSG